MSNNTNINQNDSSENGRGENLGKAVEGQ